MIQFDLPKQKSSIIKVLGVGGGGSNAVNYMFAQNIEGVDFIICNTDAKAIEQSNIPNKIQLGPHLTQGLGAGANPEVGKKATEESLEEIKRILEVNTKMAFITVGMGGGTGTGGAPIIAQICKDLGILTVGIVTTPFGFEGPRRLQQAEEGIKALRPFVDTLLVISNDKLRMQYGNLKMKEAFAKADNVLATAAKCITDVINSRGHIIVDFADVCTVMKNGGSAILGKGEVEGENRAQLAIEQALNSPLLSDSEIKGAKWILININSAEGEHECSMDELEIINTHLRMQAGEDADVIVGMGYDQSLDKKIGITVIATGFKNKDPFAKPEEVKVPEVLPAKEVVALVLDFENTNTPVQQTATLPVQTLTENQDNAQVLAEDVLMPILKETASENKMSAADINHLIEEKESHVLHFELNPELTEAVTVTIPSVQMHEMNASNEQKHTGGLLNKPANIYAEENRQQTSISSQAMPVVPPTVPPTASSTSEEEPETEMKLVEKPEASFTDNSGADNAVSSRSEQMQYDNFAEEQKRKASERIQKLRNLSYNNAADINNEFDTVPAYIRRNMELFGNTLASVENYYSKYTVGKDENNETQISTINTFLDGKKPD